MDPQTVIILVALILGLTMGSFLNVVIYRLPIWMKAEWKKDSEEYLIELAEQGEDDKTALLKALKAEHELTCKQGKTFNIAWPGSHCPKCKNPIPAWQNIPIISYLLLKGRCSQCQVKISLRYPIVELVTGLLSMVVAIQLGYTFEGGLVLVLTWCLVALTMIDVDEMLLPDNIVMPMLWLGLLANACYGLFTDLSSAIVGATAGYMSLWLLNEGYKLLRGREGMGMGDAKLLALFGAWLGWQCLPVIIMMAAPTAAIIGIGGMAIYGNNKHKPLPFGPYLAVAGWVCIFWGQQIMDSYLELVL